MSKLKITAPDWAKGLSDNDFLKLLKGKESHLNKLS